MYYKSYTEKAYPKELISFIKENREDNISFVYELIKVIKKLYKINEDIKVSFISDKESFGGGVYIDATKEIRFYKHVSFITALHEVRHLIQYNAKNYKDEFKENYSKKEEDARKWSCSLYYICYPEEYLEKAKNKELIFV